MLEKYGSFMEKKWDALITMNGNMNLSQKTVIKCLPTDNKNQLVGNITDKK